ncbi:hypothetical protein HU200_028098 [Digitaria exilis]|uniref:Uncharacterized protein n=1 Tax=Digitaria exilis TaxID=1010633 RepID=A0A835BWI4_9POAL|nr:hypothetical protein HU200_028098 [Digitaria exilis]
MYSDPVPFHRPGSSQWSPNQRRSPKTVIKSTITDSTVVSVFETEWPRLMRWVSRCKEKDSQPSFPT